MAGGQGFQPQGIDALVARLGDMQSQIDALRSALGVGLHVDGATGDLVVDDGRNVIVPSGSVIVEGGGGVQVVDPTSGLTSVFTGSSPNANAVPSAQMVFELFRADGTTGLAMGDYGTTPGHALRQSLQWFDRSGRVVLADDTVGGEGLAAPHVHGTGGPIADTNVATWPATTATTWTTIADGYWEFQNPLLTWQINLQADTATTGQFRVQVAGSTVSTVQTVTGGFSTWSVGTVGRPAGVNVGDTAYVALQAQRTAGTGTIRAITQRWAGDQS